MLVLEDISRSDNNDGHYLISEHDKSPTNILSLVWNPKRSCIIVQSYCTIRR